MNKYLFQFFRELGNAVDEVNDRLPPRVEMTGWWWKRFIPHYQRMRWALQGLIDFQWKNGMQEEVEMRVSEAIKNKYLFGDTVEEQELSSPVAFYRNTFK